MTIIEQLKYHEKDQLSEWIDSDDKVSRRFSKDIVKFANEYPEVLKDYCVRIHP